MDFVVYILYSEEHNKIYTGYTSDLVSRFHSHNGLSSKGWTKRYRPWKVVYCEFYKAKQEAMLREKYLKSGSGREWIHRRLKEEYPCVGFISAAADTSSNLVLATHNG
jgi:putative endonuclease